jgi:ubiquinone/menaquinone biosynthesis C-methylase UbiE
VRRFRYVLDPLCISCCLLYAANRWWIKPHTGILFFHYWFSDILLIPCALPPVLLTQRWLGLRADDRFPSLAEIFWHWAGWSVLFEWIGPHILPTTGDPLDVVAYGTGATVSYLWWRWRATSPENERRANFDRLAPFYTLMERALAGRKLQRCRAAFLEALPAPQRVLIVGQGRGRFLEELLRRHPGVRCTCVDSSGGMIAATQRRLAKSGLRAEGVEFIHADILGWSPCPGAYDVVVTHFVLDCFRPDQLARVLPILAGAAAPGARWLLADFCEPPAGLGRWRARAILELMYGFFQWATGLPASQLTAPDALMEQCGFALQERRVFEWGLLHSDLWVAV